MELLTGKCKEDFQKWFLLNNGYISLSDRYYLEFLEMPISFQYGVLVDFFDSVGIYVEITNRVIGWNDNIIEFMPTFLQKNRITRGNHNKTRPEARKQAIIKANELYNKQHG